MSANIKNIVEGADIPSIPHVLQQILMVTNDPNSSSSDLEKLILTEPGLVTHLLKTVNSAYYAFSTKITSVNHAIVMLGFSTVSGIASGLALIDAFNNIPGLNREYVLKVWKHALSCAGMIKVLAKGFDKKEQEKLFLTAMVQNVGHLVLSQYLGDKYEALLHDTDFPSIEDEQEKFEMDHMELGAYLLETWKFSPEITTLVAAHHKGGESKEILYLEICDVLAREGMNLNEFMEQEEADLDPKFLDCLTQADLRWDQIRENKELILQSISISQQIIAG